jgi:hypothetical protein
MLHLEVGRYQDAEPLLDRAIQIFDKILQTKKHILDLRQFEIIASPKIGEGELDSSPSPALGEGFRVRAMIHARDLVTKGMVH